MAARKHLFHPDDVKEKIRVSQLINRLHDHALSDAPLMDATQVNAINILLRKVVPDLSAAHLTAHVSLSHEDALDDLE